MLTQMNYYLFSTIYLKDSDLLEIVYIELYGT